MVMNAVEAKHLIAIQQQTGRTLVVAFQGSLSPNVRTASAMLQAGKLGRLLSISATVWQGWGPNTAGTWRQVPAMAGGGFDRPHFCCAWPTGEVGAMGLEGAVKLGHRDHLAKIADPAAREAEYRRLVDELYERGKALNAASLLEFDAVIDPADTRDTIERALSTAGPCAPGPRYADAF